MNDRLKNPFSELGDVNKAGEEFLRPDPIAGSIGDGRYAAHWEAAHRAVEDSSNYRRNYVQILMLDSLLKDGYRLLDVGCGTAGYHRLLARHGSVVGLDPIPEMIATAERFRTEFGVQNATYSCDTLEGFEEGETFDAVHMPGIYGWYRPWHGQHAVLAKVGRLLKPSGVAVLSYVPPTSPIMALKAWVAPGRTVVVFRHRFLAMVRKSGFEPMFELRLPHTIILFARRN